MLSSNTLATWCKEPTYWKRPWSWKRLKAKGEGGSRGWDSQIASPTWIWANSGIVKDRGAWHAVVRGVAKSQTLLSYWTTNGGLGEGKMSRWCTGIFLFFFFGWAHLARWYFGCTAFTHTHTLLERWTWTMPHPTSPIPNAE